MGMVIGIDVGGSTTKIIGVDKEGIKHPMIVKAEDPITSANTYMIMESA